MFKFNAKFEADLLLYSLSHFECEGHTIHTHGHSMTSTAPTDQCSEVVIVHTCAFQFTLLGSVDVLQTVLIILTMAGLFPDTPRTPRANKALVKPTDPDTLASFRKDVLASEAVTNLALSAFTMSPPSILS